MSASAPMRRMLTARMDIHLQPKELYPVIIMLISRFHRSFFTFPQIVSCLETMVIGLKRNPMRNMVHHVTSMVVLQSMVGVPVRSLCDDAMKFVRCLVIAWREKDCAYTAVSEAVNHINQYYLVMRGWYAGLPVYTGEECDHEEIVCVVFVLIGLFLCGDCVHCLSLYRLFYRVIIAI